MNSTIIEFLGGKLWQFCHLLTKSNKFYVWKLQQTLPEYAVSLTLRDYFSHEKNETWQIFTLGLHFSYVAADTGAKIS